MPFVKRDRGGGEGGGGRERGKERGSEKVGREEEGSNGLSCTRCEDSSLESSQHQGERQKPWLLQSPQPSLYCQREENQWLTAFNQSSALGRSIQKKGAQQGGPYRSVFTYAVKHYFTGRITISISQCHSLFKRGESIQSVSFLFSRFHCGREMVKGWGQCKWSLEGRWGQRYKTYCLKKTH